MADKKKNGGFRKWAEENRLTVDKENYRGKTTFGAYVVCINHWCHRIVLWVAQISLIIMLCTVFVNVILRFCFNSGIAWAEEVPGLLVTLFTFIACAIGVRDHLHISVNLVYDRLKKGGIGRKIFDELTNIVTLICGIAFLYGGWSIMTKLMKRTGKLPMTGWPTWIQYIPLVVGGFIMIFDSILFILKLIDPDDLLYSEKEIDYKELLKEQEAEEKGGKN